MLNLHLHVAWKHEGSLQCDTSRNSIFLNQIVRGNQKIFNLQTTFSLSIRTSIWRVTLTSKMIKIGCELHSVNTWKNFDDERIDQMDKKALKWWRKWKPFVLNSHAMLVEIYGEPTQEEKVKDAN